ncbi:MAG: cytochrome c biogenesis protein CcdA [Candidatus Caldarchaeales archaeon]
MSFDPVTVVLVFLAGLSTVLSPCGYSLLPALAVYGLTSDPRPSRIAWRVALLLAGALLTLSALTALAISFREALRALMPNLNLAAGALCVSLGVAGVAPRVGIPMVRLKGMGDVAVLLAGSAYSLGAAGCAVPTFVVLLTYALAAGPEGALALVAAYALGVAVPLTALVAASSLLGSGLVRRFGAFARHAGHLSRAVLVGAGLYLVYLWYAA